jgi:hypothetical protein
LNLLLKFFLKLFLNICVQDKDHDIFDPGSRSLDPVVTDYLYLGINTGEKDMFLILSKDKIMMVLELSCDRSRLIAHLTVLHL